ncbi:carbon monoxide dehydrogenase [Streptomyces sp. NPDC006446]|uniref:carbon monoxide dehydrogenase n=1 Tax=Streptomyces sp. NPDC006446 TaxID=3154301 RepID=UPI0033B59429
MEHEVFVPFPAGRLREALADPVRIARAVPGLQQDASAVSDGTADTGAPPASGTGQDAASGTGEDAADRSSRAGREPGARVAGRLKVRVAGHTITYRGAFRVTAQDEDSYAVEGDATEVRGGGTVKLALTLRLVSSDGGTTLAFGGTASGDGRVAELPHDAVSSAGLRLLTRFGEALAAGLATPAASTPDTGPSTDTTSTGVSEPDLKAAAEPEPEPGAELESEPDAGAEPESEPDAGQEAGTESEGGHGTEASSVFEAEVPPPSLDSSAGDGGFDGEDFVAEDEEPGGADAMAEAAHARRTMIGRSAEEVDHAPPRGRYAPVPPPEATAARATLRWAAPAAALALASAIAVTRALRKRR